DGIGKETMPEGVRVLDAAARKFGIDLAFDHFDFSSWDYFEKHGQMLPDDWKEQIGGHDAIFFGAVGWPEKIPDHVSLWGSLLKFAFELAHSRHKKHLTSATKSNGISITMPYWDERVAEMARHYPGVALDKFHIDILTAHFVQRPDFFDVVVASNLFGDILSDLGPACTGTIGIAPSANLDPERRFPSLFEPVHGSAPDIAGRKIANPIGQIWCGAMMLEFLGHKDAHDAILRAIEKVLDPASGAPR